MEDAAKVAKETIHGPKAASSTQICKLHQKKALSVHNGIKKSPHSFPEGLSLQRGKTGHFAKDYWFINAKCRFFQKKGHIELVCL